MSTSGTFLTSDAYKKLDPAKQASVQKEMATANKQQASGVFNGASPTEIAKKYGLYTAPTYAQKVDSTNANRAQTQQRIESGYYNDPYNRGMATSDELYANDLYRNTGDTSYYGKTYNANEKNPWDDLPSFFNVPQQATQNETLYNAFTRQSDAFKGASIAGQGLGYQPVSNDPYGGQGGGGGGSYGGGGGGGAGGGFGVGGQLDIMELLKMMNGGQGKGGGEFDDMMKMFMVMMMGQNGQGGGQGGGYTPMQYGDGVHLYSGDPTAMDGAQLKIGNARDTILDKLLKDLGMWEGGSTGEGEAVV